MDDFCQSDPANILYSDHDYIAFKDINPSAKLHFLVIPRKHLGPISHLSAEHIVMLKKMKEIALKVLDDHSFSTNQTQLGFHVPPFNSIHHLHLHGIGLPFNNWFRSLKYPKYEALWWTNVIFHSNVMLD